VATVIAASRTAPIVQARPIGLTLALSADAV